VKSVLRALAQLLLYVPLMALIGTFSSHPQFRQLAPDQALVRLSFIHAAARKHACRERSAAELAKLAPNMRAALDCPRERAAVLVELELDGKVVLERTVPPTGLRHDGAAVAYYRLPVPAGRHRVVARLRDTPEGGFNHRREATLELAPGAVLLIDFDAAKGGFVFRS
jgi:hypothetical protein